MIIFTKKGQRLGDLAANTIVIRLKDTQGTKTLYTKLPEDYEIKYPEVNRLSVEDIYTVKEVLDFLKKSGKSTEAILMADKTRHALEQKMVEGGHPVGH